MVLQCHDILTEATFVSQSHVWWMPLPPRAGTRDVTVLECSKVLCSFHHCCHLHSPYHRTAMQSVRHLLRFGDRLHPFGDKPKCTFIWQEPLDCEERKRAVRTFNRYHIFVKAGCAHNDDVLITLNSVGLRSDALRVLLLRDRSLLPVLLDNDVLSLILDKIWSPSCIP